MMQFMYSVENVTPVEPNIMLIMRAHISMELKEKKANYT
jgi:hypothetical protein